MSLLTRSCLTSLALAVLLAPVVPGAHADNLDLWDVSQGASVTAHSPLLQWAPSSASNMFGAALGAEPGNTVFIDRQPAGTIHWVEWQTPAAVTMRSFNLIAAHDGQPCDARYRGISRFTLYGWGGSAFDVLLYDFSPTYGDPPLYTPAGPAFNVLNLWAEPLALISTNRWRAEFVQLANLAGDNDGPRIVELDGFSQRLPGQQIPEPSLLFMFALAAAGLAGRRHVPWRSR